MDPLKKSYKCIIVDDNELDRLTIVSFARKYPFLRITGVFESAAQALEATRESLPDVLMLDIDMPEINGLDLRRQLARAPACIFITAHPEYALESFETAALDFLVKPLRSERFEKAMERLEQFLDIHFKAGLLDHTMGEDSLFIKEGREHIKLQLDEIIYLEALKDYTGVITRQKKYCVLTPLGSLLKEKSFRRFIRIHRSYAIQKQFVNKITAKEVLVNGTSLPIGRSYKDGLEGLLKFLTLIPLLLVTVGLFAQKQGQPLIDSLVAALPKMKDDSNKVRVFGRLSQAYVQYDPRQGFAYINSGLALAEKISWKKGVANLHNNLGLMIGDTGNNTLAREHFEQSYILNKELDSKVNQINNLNNIGRSYQRESDFSRATEYFFRALTLAEQTKNDERIALVATGLTNSYTTQKNYPKAAGYAEMAIRHGQLAKAPEQEGKGLLMMGVIKLHLKDTVAARTYMTKALTIYESTNNKPQVAQVYSDMADLEIPDYKKVVAAYLKAQAIYDQIGPGSVNSIGNMTNTGSAYYNLALISKGADRELYLRKSETYLLRGEELCKQTSNTEYLATIYLSLAGLEEERRDYKLALEHYKKASGINDSLYSQDKKNDLAGLEGKHAITLKDNEILLNKLRLSNQRRAEIGLIAGLLLASVIGGLLYRQGRNRKRSNTTLMVLNNQLDEANKVKTKFFGILSHDLRSPVSNLIHFLHLQKNDPDLLGPEQQARHQQTISQSAENLLTNMEAMLLWSKEQMESFKPSISQVAVADLFEYLQKFFSRTAPVTMQFNLLPGLVISTDENYLRVIMQNLTANAIRALKDTPDGRIIWNARMEGARTLLSITDNGPGISAEQMKALYEDNAGINSRGGFGFHLVRDLARAIQYKISIQSQPGRGTTFTLSA